jgi:hypothetical protein
VTKIVKLLDRADDITYNKIEKYSVAQYFSNKKAI